MKQIYSFILTIFILNSAFAQTQTLKFASAKNRLHILSYIMQNSNSIKQEQRTTLGIALERIVAQSTTDNTLHTLSDSVYLSYSASRGSTFDFNYMLYAYNYPYNATPLFNFSGLFTQPKVLFDTYAHWTINPNTLVYGYYESAYGGYDISNNLISFHDVFVDSITNRNTTDYNTFDIYNNITKGETNAWVSGIADSAFKQYFSYNTANKLIKDSIYEYHLGSWHLAAKSFYIYDGSNNLIQIDCYGNTTDTTFLSVLQEQLQYINTYDGSNRLLTVLTNIYDGTTLAQSAKDTFAYTGVSIGHNFNTSWRDYQYDNINHYWAPIFNMTKVLNGAGLPDTVNIKGFDSLLNSWVPQTMEKFVYDSYFNPDTMYEYDYNFTYFPSTPNYTTVYYYNLFTSTLAISNTNTNNKFNTITIYPNPAKNSITINTQNSINSAFITLINSQGQLVRREKLDNTSNVNIQDLVPGIYSLLLQDMNGNYLLKQNIIKE